MMTNTQIAEAARAEIKAHSPTARKALILAGHTPATLGVATPADFAAVMTRMGTLVDETDRPACGQLADSAMIAHMINCAAKRL